MRLIDADVLKKGLVNHCAFGKEWDRTLAICEVDSAQTVDAIPVEWILNYMNNSDCDSLTLMLADWRTKGR